MSDDTPEVEPLEIPVYEGGPETVEEATARYQTGHADALAIQTQLAGALGADDWDISRTMMAITCLMGQCVALTIAANRDTLNLHNSIESVITTLVPLTDYYLKQLGPAEGETVQ